MFFSELYSAYYNAVAEIIEKSLKGNDITPDIIRKVCSEHAFYESSTVIVNKLLPSTTNDEELWMVIKPELDKSNDKEKLVGKKFFKNKPTMPLTTLEKQWLKSVYSDPRIRLFTDDVPDIPDVEPLFTPEDLVYFDRYSDGDNYTDENYIRNFRFILDTLKKNAKDNTTDALEIEFRTLNNTVMHTVMIPDFLEYSEKDDKFRLTGIGSTGPCTVNLGRIINCKVYEGELKPSEKIKTTDKCQLELEITNDNNTLERVLLHFANFAKKVVRIDDRHYTVNVSYDKNDESEMLIRVLSFGSHIRVTAPESLVTAVKQRLEKQIKFCN